MSEHGGGGGMTAGGFFAWALSIGASIFIVFMFYGMALEGFGDKVENFAVGFRFGKSELIFLVLVIGLTIAMLGLLITSISLGKLGGGQKTEEKH